MEYTEIKEWLDWQIDRINEQIQNSNFNNQIKIIEPIKWIAISCGIDILADAIGVKLIEELREDMDTHYRYSFSYRGYDIVQLEYERLVSFVSV